MLAARRLSVVEAVAESLDGGGALDLFRVVDADFRQELASDYPVVPVAPGVPDWRLNEVSAALVAAAEDELHPDAAAPAGVVPLADVPGAIAAARPFGEAPPALPPEPPRVTFDTESSDTCAVFDVFAADAPGLLFALARTLADLGLPVRLAKIGTHLDQVVDVFYVTDAEGEKLTDPDRLEVTRAALLDCVRGLGKRHLTPLTPRPAGNCPAASRRSAPASPSPPRTRRARAPSPPTAAERPGTRRTASRNPPTSSAHGTGRRCRG